MTAVDTPAMLRGPDPEQFRTSHYGARWYIDPLPADGFWPATQDKWPSVTTIKKAWSKPFRKKLPTGAVVPLDAYWAAQFTVDNLEAINALHGDRAAVMELICGAGARTLNRAADRGTGVHTVLEDLAAGKGTEEILAAPEVAPFVPACAAFVADLQPRWIATEFVVINRTLGFGGTGDAIVVVQIPGAGDYVALTDWKSRGGEHGCYEEEVAQIGGYSLADYLIVTGPDGRPTRAPMPRLDGGLIVSLNADGYAAYPVALDQAQAAFRSMRTSWHEHREGQKAARKGRQQPIVIISSAPPAEEAGAPHGEVPAAGQADTVDDAPVAVSADRDTPVVVATPERVAWLHSRITAIVGAGHEGMLASRWNVEVVVPPVKADSKLTDEQVSLVADWCDKVEAETDMPFGTVDPVFAGLLDTDQTPVVTESKPHPGRDLEAEKNEAKRWVDASETLLAELPDTTRTAIVDAAGIRPGARMTEELHGRIEALADALETGAVEPDPDVVDRIVPAADAEARMIAAAGGKGEARDRAARLAKRAGRMAPRSLAVAAKNPLLVALVVAGHGANNTNPTEEEEEAHA
jgi:hypothetical protein